MNVIEILVTLGLGILALVLSGSGILLLIITCSSTFLSIKSKSWPNTEGTIIGTKIVERDSTDSETGIKSIQYEPALVYSYKLGNTEYTSSRVSFQRDGNTPIFDKKESAKKKLEKYPWHTVVRVFYNPKNPQQSTLETGLQLKTTILFLSLSFILIGIGVGVGVLFM